MLGRRIGWIQYLRLLEMNEDTPAFLKQRSALYRACASVCCFMVPSRVSSGKLAAASVATRSRQHLARGIVRRTGRVDVTYVNAI